MINKKIGVLLLLMVLFSMGAKAQLTTSVKLNEVLVVNEDNFVDDYGKRHPWFEFFNNSAGTVDLRGCYFLGEDNLYGTARAHNGDLGCRPCVIHITT